MTLYPFEQMKSVPSGLDYSLKDFLRQNKSNTELLMQIAESMGVSVTALQDTIAEHEATLEMARYENWIINGAFNLWQRGTSYTSPGDGVCLPDRFKHYHFNDGAVTISRNTDVPGSSLLPGVQYSYYVDVTTADTSIGASQYEAFQYHIEGYDAYQLYGRTCTLSFWVKSNKTGIYSILCRNNGNDRSYIAEYTIYQPDTWEKKTITILINYSGGTNNWTNGKGLVVGWALACGSTFSTSSLGVWLSTNMISSTNQVNLMASTSNYFQITGVQLNIGSTAAPFISRPMQQELALAQRYYEKSYLLGDPPGTITQVSAAYQPYVGGLASAVYYGGATVFYKVSKRTIPTFHSYSHTTGTIDKITDQFNTIDVTPTYYCGGETGILVTGTVNAACVGIAFCYHWTADAEL